MLSTTKLQGPCNTNCFHYKALIQDLTSQSQELRVKDHLLKFQIDTTVNEIRTFILRKVRNVEKWVAPQNKVKKRKCGCTKINSSRTSKCSINPWPHENIKSCTAPTSILMMSKRKKRRGKLITLHHIHVNQKEEVEELISCKKTCSSRVNEEKTITHAGHGNEEGYIMYIH